MELRPLTLAVTTEGWRLLNLRKADPAFRKFEQHILARDDNTCQYCGFKSTQHQEVVNIDNNYQNNRTENLATACCFCAQCFFLESAGRGEYGGGTLIYLPELAQSELNGFCHGIFTSISNDDNCGDDAQSIYRSLKLRSKIVEQELGEGGSNPAVLGQLLIDQPIDDEENTINRLFQNLRLLPSREKFQQQIMDWAAEAESENPHPQLSQEQALHEDGDDLRENDDLLEHDDLLGHDDLRWDDDL